MKFIGHLDVMRYFQKVMRRADVDIAYSEGFSPHQIMSFAAPLGVGLTSKGEYFDIEVHSTLSSEEMINRMNKVMVEGVEVLSYRRLEDNSKNAMSLVAGADYKVKFREQYKPDINLKEEFEKFISQETIEIVKKTKKSEKLVDIKPMIYETYVLDDESIFMKLTTGSANNLKPDLVMQAFSENIGFELHQFGLEIERLELYGLSDNKLIPLEDFGELV
jgi:radical SAM-linked protein